MKKTKNLLFLSAILIFFLTLQGCKEKNKLDETLFTNKIDLHINALDQSVVTTQSLDETIPTEIVCDLKNRINSRPDDTPCDNTDSYDSDPNTRDFPHLVIFNTQHTQREVFKRPESSYETKLINGNLPVSKLINQYSVSSLVATNVATIDKHGTIVRYHSCNYIDIGNNAELICLRFGNTNNLFTHSRIKNIPDTVMTFLEGGVNDKGIYQEGFFAKNTVGFIILATKNRPTLLKNPMFEVINQEELVEGLTLQYNANSPVQGTITLNETNPCCCQDTSGGYTIQTCRKGESSC